MATNQPTIIYGGIQYNEPKRNLGRDIARFLLPQQAENWFLGSKEDEELLNKYSDSDIPTLEELTNGDYSKDDILKYSELRKDYDVAKANREYTDLRNANIGQGIVDIGSAAIGGGGATATKAGIGLLKPYLGKKIATSVTQGALGGGLGGAFHGIGTGLVQEDVNPITQGLKEGASGAALGGIMGLGIGQAGKYLDAQKLLRNNALKTQYFDDYVEGLSNDSPLGKQSIQSRELNKFRQLDNGLNDGNTEGMSNFIGENAFNAPKGKLMQAQNMTMYGDEPAYILDETGWFKGVDGKWRYEIPDGKMIDKPNLIENFDDDIGKYYTGNLGDIYDAPELYQAYPKLKDIDIVIQDMPNGIMGSSIGDSISLNKGLYKKDNPAFLKLKEELEATPEYKEYNKAYKRQTGNPIDDLAYIENAEKTFFDSDIGKKYHSLMWDRNYPVQRKIQGFNDNALDTLVHEIQHQIQGIEGFARGGSNKNLNYHNLAGEVEARLAERRSKLTPEQRNLYNVISQTDNIGMYGYDVRPEKQIVEFKNGLYQKLIDDEFDYDKVIQEVQKRKAPKPIDPILKNEGEIVIMKGSEPFEKGEINKFISDITSQMSQDEMNKGFAVRELNGHKVKLKYNKNGKHTMGKYKTDERLYDENR